MTNRRGCTYRWHSAKANLSPTAYDDRMANALDLSPASTSLPRRAFCASTAAALSAAAVKSASAANEKINVGFIGYGLIGKRHVLDFQAQPDVNIAAVAECHEGR